MNTRRMLLLFTTLLAIGFGLSDRRAVAATPTFTLSAGNTTFTASGPNTVSWTVQSVDGYTGTVYVDNCGPANPPMSAKLPYCGGSTAPAAITVPANGAASGMLPLFAFPVPSPVKLNRTRKGLATGLALAGALLLGFGFRRHKARWFALMLLALGTLAVMAGISACGSSNTLTPGVWPYTVSATDTNTLVTVSATFNVTVPSGIPAP